MNHPFQSIQDALFRRIFLPSILATLGLLILLNVIGEPLVQQDSPYGIVSFELAGSIDQVQRMLASWDSTARLHAAFSLGLDYVFMLAYSTSIGLACIWSAGVLRARNWPLASAGSPLAWGQWLAAGFDIVENIALISILFGRVADPWPGIAQWSAVIKFSLVFAGLVYAFLGLVVRYLPAEQTR